MNLIILSAGRGRRLKSKTNQIPKPLVSLFGKKILQYQIDIIKKFKSIKPILILGYKHFLFNNYKFLKVVNKEYNSTNMVYSLFKAEKYIKKDLIISYSDIIYSKNILQKLIKKKGDIVVAIDMNFRKYWMKRFKNPLDDIESCKIKKNQIYDIGRKVNSFTEIDGQYIGLIKLSSKGSKIFCQVHKDLKKYNKDVLKKMYMTDFLQILIKKGHKLTACKFYTPWIEVDNQNDLKIIEHKNRIKKILKS